MAKPVSTHIWWRVTDKLPPEGIIVATKVDDETGKRNEQALIRKGNLWFHDDGMMYVYYTPTHWKDLI